MPLFLRWHTPFFEICGYFKIKRLKQPPSIAQTKIFPYLCPRNARMAESVDAPVSNTGGATHPGSIPGPGTKYGC